MYRLRLTKAACLAVDGKQLTSWELWQRRRLVL